MSTRATNPILSWPRWSRALLPGLHIKRWLLLLFIGVTLAGLGLAVLITEWYTQAQAPLVFRLMALHFLPDWLRGLILLSGGLILCIVGVWYLNRSIMVALLPGQTIPRNLEMVNVILDRQRRRQGPRVVAIGGGTGMPQLLRGLRTYTDNITAIVTVADDGGSSGLLRRQMGMLPPGDFRNNIAALSEAEDLMTRLFQYRFAETDVADDRQSAPATHGAPHDEPAPPVPAASPEPISVQTPVQEPSALAGHSFGNLFIATMAAVTGSFESGIAESSRVLAVRGQILPSTLEQITLCAELARTTPEGDQEWLVVEGESKIPSVGGQIMRVFLKPEQARAYPLTVQAILQADFIVAGPGSFFTSVLPNLLVPAIRDAICASRAPRVYICNCATQPGETDGYSVSDHMQQLRRHAGDAFTTVLANDHFSYSLNSPTPFVGNWVSLPEPGAPIDYQLFTGDLIETQRPWRHDPQKLAARLMEVYHTLEERQHLPAQE